MFAQGNFNDLDIKWFEGAKTNLSYNCLDRHLENKSNDTALIYVPNDPNKENEDDFIRRTYTKELFKWVLSSRRKGLKKVIVFVFIWE